MASSVNKVILLGRLGRTPEIKYLPSGQAVCDLSVATSQTYKDRNEQQQERTEWSRVVVWGKTAESCAKYLQKGQQVYVEGRLETRSWDDKEGKKVYATDVVASNVVFLGGGEQRGASGGGDGGRGEGSRGEESRGGGGYGGGRASGPSTQQRKAQSEPPVGDGAGGDLFQDDDWPF
jgi:single-strand DNA-binding protein